MGSYAVVVADGPRAGYGITACLGALEDLPLDRYPSVHWPADEPALIDVIGRLRADGIRPVVLWQAFSPAFAAVTQRHRRVRAAGDAAAGGGAAAGAGAAAGGVANGPTALHILGGPHASAEPRDCARAGFDLVAAGEGEITMRLLADALDAGEDPRDVPGLAGVGVDGFVPSPGRAVACLDEVPSFAMRQRRIGPIEITRGCVYACRFCHTPYVFRASFRHRGVDSVRAHVRWMLSLGKRQVRFLTPTAMSYGAAGADPDLDAVERLLAGVRSELPLDGRIYFGTFPSEIRPEHATRETLALVKRWADNDNVIIGAQSGSDTVLAAAHRGHDVDCVRTAVDHCAALGLLANVDVIFGMPGESDDDVQATLALCRDLVAAGARIHTHTFLPLPGTPWRDMPPGTVPEPIRAQLGELTARGAAYGSWERQEEVARALAALPSDRVRPRRTR